MKWFYTRKEIDQLSALELKALHRSMIRVVFALLTLSAIVSILAIWAFIPHYFQYIVLIVGRCALALDSQPGIHGPKDDIKNALFLI